MNWILFSIGCYVLLQLAIGLVVSRRIHTETDYVLAGRRLGYGLATFSIFATWFGAETCIGTSAEVYEHGLSAAAHDPFGYGLCILLMALLLAGPLWRRGLTTLGDLFRERFGAGAERLAALMMIPTSVLWAAAQIRGFGQVLVASSSLQVELAIALAAAVVILYTAMGGLLADAVTDLVQGGVLIVGLLAVFYVVISDLGGFRPAVDMIDTRRLNLFVSGESPSHGLLLNLEAWMVPICGSVVAQELIARVLGSRSPQVARRSALMATGLYLGIGLIPVFLGLIGPRILPDLAEPEQLLTQLFGAKLHPVLHVIFAGALVSAILSTVDSALLAASTICTENLLGPWLQLSPEAKLKTNRRAVALFGVVAYLFAIRGGGIFELVSDASSFGSAGIFVLVLLALFTKFGGKWCAIATLLVGTGLWLWAHYFTEIEYPYVLALGGALAACVVVGAMEIAARERR